MTIPALYHLVQKIRDPDKEKRDQLNKMLQMDPTLASKIKAQIGGDADALGSIVGQAPRFFGNGGRDALLQTIQNAQPDSATLENKFKSNEMQNLLGLQQLFNPNIANASARVDTNYLTPDMLQGPTEEQANRYAEAQASAPSGRIVTQTPMQRLQEKSELNRSQAGIKASEASTAAANASTAFDQFRLGEAQNDKAIKEAQKKIRDEVFAKFGTGPQLLAAFRGKNDPKKGNLSSEQIHALENDPGGSKLLDDLRDEEYKKQMLDLERQKTAHLITGKDYLEQADISMAKVVAEKLGGRVNPSDIVTANKIFRGSPGLREKIADLAPEDANKDPQTRLLWDVAKATTEMRSKITPKDIIAAQAKLNSSIAPLLDKIRGVGKEQYDPAQVQGVLDQINNEVANVYGAMGFDNAPKYGVKYPKPGFFGGKGPADPRIVSGDPQILKALGIKTQEVKQEGKPIDNALTTPKKDLTAADKFKLADAWHTKYPNMSPEEIQKKVENGETP